MINYEQDFYGWTQEQAEFLRSGRLMDLDIENLIEEVETMGRSEKRALESSLSVLLVHLLKWKYQPSRRGRSWQLTIKTQRVNFVKILRDNPGLKPSLDQCMADAYQIATIKASQETYLDEDVFPASCPWNFEDVVNHDFLPD